MINQKIIISEELELPNIPKRSRLYCLEPIAVGTLYVEGLISYICRLAEAHSVSPGTLIKKEILPCFRQHYSINVGGAYAVQTDGNSISVFPVPKPVYRKNPNEYGLLSWQYFEGLKRLTLRADLQTLIIPADTNQVLGGMTEQELGRDLRAWCPECFQAWRTVQHPIYEPLLWSIAIVTVCPIHHKPLQFRCPHCQKAQRPFTSRMYVARCSQCSGWLDIRAEAVSDKKFVITSELNQQSRFAEQATKVLSLWNNSNVY